MRSRLTVLVCLILVTLGLTACSSRATELPPDVLFRDDFSDQSSGWDRIESDEGASDYNQGVYRIIVNSTQTSVWANPGLNFEDVHVEVDATNVGGPDDNDFGIICRYKDELNFYFFIISSDGFYAIGKVKQGDQELLSDGNMLPSEAINQGNLLNHLRADCVGSELTFLINGVNAGSIQDGDFEDGDVGLTAGTFGEPGTIIHFDNFLVKQP